MKQRRLGVDGPQVGAIGLGCMSFAGAFGETTLEESLTAMDAAWDLGMNFWDTANVYGMGRSEDALGTWLKSRPHRPVIATKAAIQRDPDRPINNDPTHLASELDGSLRRLGLDHVELFYVHRREQSIPIEDIAGLMGQLIAQGKIGGWGLSEVSPTTLRRAHAETPVRAVQNEYSLWTRQPELGMLHTCAELGAAFVPFSPLARGVLGRNGFSIPIPELDDFRAQMPRFFPENWAQNAAQIDQFRAFAQDIGTTAPALALAWVLAKGDHLIPIPASRYAAHIQDWAAAVSLDITPEIAAQIDHILPAGWAWGDRYSDAQAAAPERYS